ncbi:hypothetical protein RHMOL_Rhmol04G0252300 [Rhododendron molle]|uniref:Uncharacterized protein n=1 Tax=Rhododendron molle TaxID=49168 RepID=A0ACC0P4G7_RHOML|nr:hypothetical protein RHMOL_Rhmol04G0252300 [Rhododendron molle]
MVRKRPDQAGKLSEAVEFISEIPIEPSAKTGNLGYLLNGASVCGAVLNVTRASVCGDVELGIFVCDRLFEIEPDYTRNYIIMANLFSRAGRWEESEKVREKMKNLGLRKIPSSSWIEKSGGLQSFIAKDVSNERTKEIYGMFDKLLTFMRDEVYQNVQCTSVMSVELNSVDFCVCVCGYIGCGSLM